MSLNRHASIPLSGLIEQGITEWVFDLDNTIYPAKSNLFARVAQKMTDFIMVEFSLPEDEANSGWVPRSCRTLDFQGARWDGEALLCFDHCRTLLIARLTEP